MKLLNILLIVFLFSILSLLIAVFLYYSHFNAGVGLSNNPTDWGTFGDYLGGVLNPFFGLLTLISTSDNNNSPETRA